MKPGVILLALLAYVAMKRKKAVQGDDDAYRAPEQCPDGYHWEKHGSVLVCAPDVSGDGYDTDRIHRYSSATAGQFAGMLDDLHAAGFDCQLEDGTAASYNCYRGGVRQLRIVHDQGDDSVVAQVTTPTGQAIMWKLVDPIVHGRLSG